MTQIMNPHFKTVSDLRTSAFYHANGERNAWMQHAQSLIVSRAHKFGCLIAEGESRRVPVKPKWLFKELERLREAHIAIYGVAIHRLAFEGTGGARRGSGYSRRQRRYPKYGRVIVTRRQIDYWRTIAGKFRNSRRLEDTASMKEEQ